MSLAYLLVTISLSLLGLSILVLNGAIIIAVIAVKQLHKASNFFLVSMASSDILVALALIPTFLVQPDADTEGAVNAVVLFTNVSNIVLLTTDRVLATFKGISYRHFIDHSYWRMILAAWFIPVIISFLPFLWKTETDRLVHKIYIMTVSVLIVASYVYILVSYGMIWRRSQSLLQPNNRPRMTTSCGNVKAAPLFEMSPQQWRLTKICATICILFCLAWSLILFLTCAGMFNYAPPSLQDIWFLPIHLVCLSSVMHPWIYSFCKRDLREVFGEWIRNTCHCCSNTREESEEVAVQILRVPKTDETVV